VTAPADPIPSGPGPGEVTVADLLDGSDAPLVAVTKGSTRVIVFNRPAVRNAMDLAVRQEFAQLTRDADEDPAVRVVIVTGAAGQFTAGVDLKEYRSGPRRPMFRPHPAEAARSMRTPVIAAVDGYCLTGGLEVALSCSFIIATDRAVFGDTHAKLGLFPSWGLSALLPRAVGVRRARQMSLTGEFISAPTALAWGLVNELTSPERLLPRCFELARAIAAANERSSGLQLGLMARYDGADLATALDAEEATVPIWRRETPAG
jgi:enoyl-CoA hydratase